MGGYRKGDVSPKEPPVSPLSSPVKPSDVDPLKKRGSFLKRRNNSSAGITRSADGDSEASPKARSKLKATGSRRRGSTKESTSYFEWQISRANSSSGKGASKKTIPVLPRYEQSVHVAQLLLSDTKSFVRAYLLLEACYSFFLQSESSYDKKLVPKQIGRCIKVLSGGWFTLYSFLLLILSTFIALEKRWLLCSVVEWDDLQTLGELREQGKLFSFVNFS